MGNLVTLVKPSPGASLVYGHPASVSGDMAGANDFAHCKLLLDTKSCCDPHPRSASRFKDERSI